MKMKNYETPELYLIQLSLTDTILASVPTPTDNEMPILSRKMMEDELDGIGAETGQNTEYLVP